ncbi:hypothetical protein [Brucella pituitosa]|uniref:hypothetical protein n=1 Tax=Brucella pituitosa TaxID=571256 RepID=UPI001FEAB483|nr:hypothetical protein [Brucella pituitosa]
MTIAANRCLGQTVHAKLATIHLLSECTIGLSSVREGLDALNNSGSFGGCGGQRQGFNTFGWIVSSAFADGTDCYILQKDGSRIQLDIKTYEQCKDAITAYLNTLSFEERANVIQSAGFAKGSGQVPATGEAILMTKWLWEAIDKLDGQPKGYYFNQWLNGNADGYNANLARGQEWAAIMADTSLSLNDMAQKLEDAGFDVGAAIAAASMGFAARGSTGRVKPNNLTEKLAFEQAMSNPAAGRPIPVPMTDKRWPAQQGWVKMAQNINGVEIHYVRNVRTGQVDDFKFK